MQETEKYHFLYFLMKKEGVFWLKIEKESQTYMIFLYFVMRY